MLTMPSFKKSLIVEQFQRNYLKLANCKTLLLSSYLRPPSSSSDSLDHLSDSIRRVFAKVPNRPNIIIGGDFNLDWHFLGYSCPSLQVIPLRPLDTRNFSRLLMTIYFFSMWKPLPGLYQGRSWICFCQPIHMLLVIHRMSLGWAITLLLFSKLIWSLLDQSSLLIRCIYITKLTLMAYENLCQTRICIFCIKTWREVIWRKLELV